MEDDQKLLEMTAGIIAAYVSKNAVPPTELPALIKSIHATLSAPGGAVEEPAAATKAPAISIKKSIQPDFLVCLEDGQKFKSLRRHLMTKYGMTPDDYRAKWGLPKDYPMVAPAYSASRAELARKIGLGKPKSAKSAKPVTRRPRKAT